MRDCIYRDEAIEIFRLGQASWEDWQAELAISELPAAKARPVVFCRDCIHYEMGVCLKIYDDGNFSKDAWQERKPDDFCSYGEEVGA